VAIPSALATRATRRICATDGICSSNDSGDDQNGQREDRNEPEDLFCHTNSEHLNLHIFEYICQLKAQSAKLSIGMKQILSFRDVSAQNSPIRAS
jgi:hypothetical protein